MKLLSGEFPSSEEPGLRVFVPREEYLFAMKCRAMRLVPSVIDLAANLRIDVCATTEILRDPETNCRKKVRGDAQRGGAGAAQHADPCGQAPSPPTDAGPHPVEGGQLGSWRRMERQPDRHSARYQHRHVARARQQLVEEGFEAVLVRKHSPASARTRIFDGAAEAKLIALACSEPPKGRKRWTLQLLEEQVVELKIVDRASDNTIGRTLKKTSLSLICKSNG
jgi:hypothetical protein